MAIRPRQITIQVSYDGMRLSVEPNYARVRIGATIRLEVKPLGARAIYALGGKPYRGVDRSVRLGALFQMSYRHGTPFEPYYGPPHQRTDEPFSYRLPERDVGPPPTVYSLFWPFDQPRQPVTLGVASEPGEWKYDLLAGLASADALHKPNIDALGSIGQLLYSDIPPLRPEDLVAEEDPFIRVYKNGERE